MGLIENTELALKIALRMTFSTRYGILLIVIFGIIEIFLIYNSEEKSIVAVILKSIVYPLAFTYTLILGFVGFIMDDNTIRFIAVLIIVIIFFIDKALTQIIKKLWKMLENRYSS
mgnify:CR=1 FL=1